MAMPVEQTHKIILKVVPTTIRGIIEMSRFKKLSHTLWHCHYHIVWVPKYRFRILRGKVAEEVEQLSLIHI